MNRTQMIARVRERSDPWDIVVIGGGATGAGVAVDAATRGFSVLLVEREDFGKGTSSRSTKLIHGGVRYLEQGNVSLVMEALRERGRLFHNAPHLVQDLPFVVPTYSWWESPFYGIGLKVYDLLAGKFGFGKSRLLSRDETLEKLPTLQLEGLRGGIVYHDGQFDDTRLLIHLLATAVDHGAAVLNYASAVRLSKGPDNFLNGVVVDDRESGETHYIPARVVVNATGIFTDEIRRLDEPNAETMVSPSQGIHLVFDQSFLRGNTAIMVPHTADGRVMFAIPWHGHTVVGTTDTPIDRPSYEPPPLEDEIEFVLETAARYLIRPPTRDDILSIYVGIRPLVKVPGNNRTASLSREHTIHIDESGLLTIVGGKWTTYRHMACVTCDLRLHGYHQHPEALGSLGVYGSDAIKIQALIEAQPNLASRLHPDLPNIAAEVVWAAREEMARNVEDILARRTRALFLNAKAAIAMAPEVAGILAAERGLDSGWAYQQVERFQALAAQYVSAVSSTQSRKG
jgi:glycerol-3-phosphate dehydrogenase